MAPFNNTRRYSPLCGLTSSSCGGLWPTTEASFALQAKTKVFFSFLSVFAYLRLFLVKNWKKSKIWKNIKKSDFLSPKITIFFYLKIWKKNYKKNAIFLVLPIEAISLWPELSSPPRFRIQGGVPWSLRTKDGQKSFCLIYVQRLINQLQKESLRTSYERTLISELAFLDWKKSKITMLILFIFGYFLCIVDESRSRSAAASC